MHDYLDVSQFKPKLWELLTQRPKPPPASDELPSRDPPQLQGTKEVERSSLRETSMNPSQMECTIAMVGLQSSIYSMSSILYSKVYICSYHRVYKSLKSSFDMMVHNTHSKPMEEMDCERRVKELLRLRLSKLSRITSGKQNQHKTVAFSRILISDASRCRPSALSDRKYIHPETLLKENDNLNKQPTVEAENSRIKREILREEKQYHVFAEAMGKLLKSHSSILHSSHHPLLSPLSPLSPLSALSPLSPLPPLSPNLQKNKLLNDRHKLGR